MSERQLKVAAYKRVSTDDQDPSRQHQAVLNAYGDHDITWYADIDESGAKVSREQYQQLRSEIDEYDVVAASELDRLGRSFAELADLVEELKAKNIDVDLVNQPIGTVGRDEWMQEIMLKMMIVFADAEREMIRSRVQEGIDRAIEQGKHVGAVPFGYERDADGFISQVPDEYLRAQKFIKEVRKGRQKKATAEFFDIPEGSIESILDRAEKNYNVEFDNDEWRIEREKVRAGEKQLDPLGED